MIRNTISGLTLNSMGHSYGVSFEVTEGSVVFSVDFLTHGYTIDNQELKQYFKQPLNPMYTEAKAFEEAYPEIEYHILHNLIEEILHYANI